MIIAPVVFPSPTALRSMQTQPASGDILGPVTDISAQKFHSGDIRRKRRIQMPAKGQLAQRSDLKKRLFDKFEDRNLLENMIFTLDADFYLPTFSEVNFILGRSRVALMDYNTEAFDCDDFAFGVKGEFSLYNY